MTTLFISDLHLQPSHPQLLAALLDWLIPKYAAEGKAYVTITLGCTGGKHRSVATAEWLREHLERQGIPVAVSHRDLGKE